MRLSFYRFFSVLKYPHKCLPITPALFSTKNLEEFIPLLRSKASRLSHLLDDIIVNEGGILDGQYILHPRTHSRLNALPKLTAISVVSLYSKITLEIMGQFAIGRELDEPTAQSCGNNSSASMSFHACYHELFEPDGVGQMLIAINSVFPIRWLPLTANRRFKQAHQTLRSQIQAVIQGRIRALDPSNAGANRGGHDASDGNPNEAKDLLTWMVARKYYSDGGDNDRDRWGEDEIRDQVSWSIYQCPYPTTGWYNNPGPHRL